MYSSCIFSYLHVLLCISFNSNLFQSKNSTEQWSREITQITIPFMIFLPFGFVSRFFLTRFKYFPFSFISVYFTSSLCQDTYNSLPLSKISWHLPPVIEFPFYFYAIFTLLILLSMPNSIPISSLTTRTGWIKESKAFSSRHTISSRPLRVSSWFFAYY